MDLVRNFVETQDEVRTLLAKDDIKGAKEKFMELHAAYTKLADSEIEHYHKEIAHKQLTAIHSKLTDEERAVRIPINMIVAGVLLVVFSFVVFMNPSIVGLITFEDKVIQPLNMTYTESKISSFNLNDAPLSLAVSGHVDGDAKVYWKRGNDLVLIFDSTSTESDIFREACVDTCDIQSDSNAVEIFVQVNEGELRLDNLVYTIPRDDNQAPVWTGKEKVFEISDDLTLDLDEYFEDPDEDQLVFLSTSADGLRVSVEDNHLTFSPVSKGEKRITWIASDLDKLTKVPVNVNVV